MTKNIRPDFDKEITAIADYGVNYTINMPI